MGDTELPTIDLSALVQKPSESARLNLALLYGPPGGGKTHLAASAVEVEEFRPVLILDTEGSTVGTLKGFGKYDKDIKILPVKDHATLKIALDALDDGTIGAILGEPGWTPKTVIIDTFDVAQERVIKVAEQKVLNETGKNDGYAKWGILKDWSNGIANKFRDAPYLGILVVHVKRTELEEGGYVDGIALSGGSKETVPGIPDVVAFVQRDQGTTTAFFESDKRRVSKNRHGLPATMEDPSFKKMHAIATSSNKEK